MNFQIIGLKGLGGKHEVAETPLAIKIEKNYHAIPRVIIVRLLAKTLIFLSERFV